MFLKQNLGEMAKMFGGLLPPSNITSDSYKLVIVRKKPQNCEKKSRN